MKTLRYILRLLYITFVCMSAGTFTVVAIFLAFDINTDELKPMFITGAFFVHLSILDIFFINTNQVKKLLGIGEKHDEGGEHF